MRFIIFPINQRGKKLMAVVSKEGKKRFTRELYKEIKVIWMEQQHSKRNKTNGVRGRSPLVLPEPRGREPESL